MPYDQEFFLKYQNYLQEPIVRKEHNRMFNLFEYMFPLWEYQFNIVEFGCGQCEYLNYAKPEKWFGFDLCSLENNKQTFVCDYTKISDKDIKEKVNFNITGFVSIFSTECCLSVKQKYEFYERLFKNHNIQAALVSGFYYKNKLDNEIVKEPGGLNSYQSIENQKEFISEEFIELRTYLNVPSFMFGQNVVECWKILHRKK